MRWLLFEVAAINRVIRTQCGGSTVTRASEHCEHSVVVLNPFAFVSLLESKLSVNRKCGRLAAVLFFCMENPGQNSLVGWNNGIIFRVSGVRIPCTLNFGGDRLGVSYTG